MGTLFNSAELDENGNVMKVFKQLFSQLFFVYLKYVLVYNKVSMNVHNCC